MRELGISSLGHIINFGLIKKDNYNDLNELLLDASDACLSFSEENKLKICELIIDPPDIFIDEKKQKFIDLCNSYSIKKQIHGPFIDLGLCSHNDKISNASVESYIETAKICQEINAKILTIHPGVANFLINSIHKYNKKQLIKALKVLLDSISDLDIKVCIENMPKKAKILLSENEIKDFFKDLNRDDLYFTYDTSHAWTVNTNIEKLWENLYDRIKNVHIVDNFDKETDTHPALGSGKINFQKIFDLIKKYDYDGSLIIEISNAGDLHKSIDFIRKFI